MLIAAPGLLNVMRREGEPMKLLGLLFALSMICIGLIALIAPYRFLSAAEYTVTSNGLYVVAALRVGVGLVLLAASSASRMPKTLRVFGIIALIAGLTTPLVGIERARAIFNWSSVHGPSVIRAWGVIALAVGGLIAYALSGKRRAV